MHGIELALKRAESAVYLSKPAVDLSESAVYLSESRLDLVDPASMRDFRSRKRRSIRSQASSSRVR